MSQYAIGVDYGTNSVRALVVDTADGRELASHVYDYPSGEAGILLDPRDPNLARQNPHDYVEGFFTSVAQALEQAKNEPGFSPDSVVGIGVDTTGSTPIPVDREGVPLAFADEFKDDLAAQAWLWKDHTSYEEAAEITEKARHADHDYLSKCGGIYSSEWYWSKILHCSRTSPKVFDAAYAWVELADFIPAYITGNLDPHTLKRSICAAGHKAMYHEQWGGLPTQTFLNELNPQLAPLRERFAMPAVAADQLAGRLTKQAAERVGLPAGVAVSVGAFDAHMGAVGSNIGPGTLVQIIGTSSCDLVVAPLSQQVADIPGVCGIVPESVLPGMHGIEAGQSAVGDIYNWFVKNLTPGRYGEGGDAHVALTREAEQLSPGASGLLALDWNNGNRTVLVDPLLSGAVLGTTLHTTAAEMYRALVEATAFGARMIIERLNEYGVAVDQVINCGGIAEKNPFVMQLYADICNQPMKISRSAQTCALGASIFGAVVGGAYADVAAAQAKMAGVKDIVYTPRPEAVAVYEQLFALYRQVHDAFGLGRASEDLGQVMKQLIRIRDQARKG